MEDYVQTKADVAPVRSIRLLLALAAANIMSLLQVDVNSAYLNGKLEEVIHMRPPDGVQDKVWLLKRPLYGLKQAGHNWRVEIDTTLKSFGFRPTDSDPGFYFLKNSKGVVYLVIHVDDMLVAASDCRLRDWFESKLRSKYAIKTVKEPKWFLHMSITEGEEANWTKVDQASYVQECLHEFGLKDCRTLRAPIPANTYLTPATPEELAGITPALTELYQRLVGSLMYLSTQTRPDIAFSAAHLGKFMHAPCNRHIEAARNVFRYLAGTSKFGPLFTLFCSGEGVPTLEGFSDANFANDVDRHSMSGYCYTYNGCLVSWGSHRQRNVSLSTEEAELIAGGEAAREGLALRSLLVQIGVLDGSIPVTLFLDNKPAIAVATNPGYYNRLKHVDIQNKFLCEAQASGLLAVRWCQGSDMLADALTKPLGGPLLDQFRKRVAVE